MVECKECGKECNSESELETHVLLQHPRLARSDDYDYTAEVSEGHLEQRKHEKGESFGY